MKTVYHISYGGIHIKADTLAQARQSAKYWAKSVRYAINIVAHGDVIETWTPRVTATGNIAFRRAKAA